jgi:hypothetical protein
MTDLDSELPASPIITANKSIKHMTSGMSFAFSTIKNLPFMTRLLCDGFKPSIEHPILMAAL